MGKVAVFIGLCVAGWLVASRARAVSLLLSYAALGMSVLIYLVTCGLGIAEQLSANDWNHGRIGNDFLIFEWCMTPFLVGAAWGRRRPGLAFLETIFGLGTLAVAAIGSMSGHLSPRLSESNDEATSNRFLILHLIVLPLLILVGHFFWLCVLISGRKVRSAAPAELPIA